jgi:hypothetical protein
MFKRFFPSLLTIGLAAAFLVTTEPIIGQSGYFGVSAAEAQQARKKPRKRRNLFEMLFGGSRKKTVRRVSKSRALKKHRRPRKKGGISAPVLAAVTKLDDAKVVLVVGDFFAGSLAKGLTRSFSQLPGVRVVVKSKGSSGFVRLDYFNWSEEIGPAIDEIKPSVVVAMIGTNDRQLMRLDGKKLQKRSEEWDAAYKVRIENFAKAVRVKNVPLVWMGLPPVRFKTMTRDFLFFNETYRSKVEKTGGQFVDIWDGFTDAEGNFVTSGPDVNGRIVRLRSKDGINVTKSGQNKLAFYAEKSVRKLVGASATAVLPGLQSETGTRAKILAPTYDPAKTGRTIAVRLDDPALDGGDVLAGGLIVKNPANGDSAANNNKVSSSLSEKAIPGRVDDASWPKKPLLPPKPQVRTTTSGQQ